MNIPAIDMVFIILILIAVLRGAFRGFVREIMAVSSVLLGILLAVLFSGLLAMYLTPLMGETVWNQVVAFLLIFIVVYLVVKLFEAGLNSLIVKINLENLDRALGIFLGLIEGVLLVFLVLFGLQIQPFFATGSLTEGSLFYQFMSPFFPFAVQVFTGSANV